MKAESEVRNFCDIWLESARTERPEPGSYDAGLASGYLLALATVLEDARTKAAVRDVIAGLLRAA